MDRIIFVSRKTFATERKNSMKYNDRTRRIIAGALAFFLIVTMVVGLAIFAFSFK